jgi:hypothetical protein
MYESSLEIEYPGVYCTTRGSLPGPHLVLCRGIKKVVIYYRAAVSMFLQKF